MLAADKLLLRSQIQQKAIQLSQKELQLFSDNFNAIGTQAALLAGFAVTSLAEFAVPPDAHVLFESCFYLLSVTTIAASLLCVCNTTFISVFGPAMALRGPDGSMVKAIDGMIIERKQAFVQFGVAIIAFLLCAVSMACLVMPMKVAIIASGGLLTTIYIIITTGNRIYKRFEVKASKITKFDDLLAADL